jgi:hypothetical protein
MIGLSKGYTMRRGCAILLCLIVISSKQVETQQPRNPRLLSIAIRLSVLP